ncbi:MAG: DsbA family protein [Myxococcota bacterium]
MINDRRHVFYGDLNCPFCFAQNERLTRLGLQHLISWRGIEHLPKLPIPKGDDVSEREVLREEIARLRTRAPDVEIHDPGFRPNTHAATAAIAAASKKDEDLAARLRTLLYRALWQEGEDISDPGILESILTRAGADDLNLNAEKGTVERWTQEWREGKFDRRIPSMLSRDGETLLGLADEEALRSFVWTQRAEDDPSASCVADE